MWVKGSPRQENMKCIIGLLVCLLFFPSVLYSQESTLIKSEGVGDILSGGFDRARDAAIEDALRKAVEQAVGIYISSETIVENLELVSDSIYTHTKGYVKEYTVLNELYEENICRVSLESFVSVEKLQDDLAAIGLLMARKHKPRIMVVIPEHHISRQIPDPAGETEIIKQLLERGFKVVDQDQVSRIRYGDQIKAGIKGNIELATTIGLEYGAEIIIIGEAFSETAGRIVRGFTTCRARVEARAIRTDTGEILVTDGKIASALDIAEAIAGKKALKKAASELATYLIEQILSKWSSDVANSTSVNMVITGLKYRQFIKFKQVLLSSVRGIKAIHQRSFSNSRAVVDLDMKGSTQSLSEELILKEFHGYDIEVSDFSANRLTIKVHTKERGRNNFTF